MSYSVLAVSDIPMKVQLPLLINSLTSPPTSAVQPVDVLRRTIWRDLMISPIGSKRGTVKPRVAIAKEWRLLVTIDEADVWRIQTPLDTEWKFKEFMSPYEINHKARFVETKEEQRLRASWWLKTPPCLYPTPLFLVTGWLSSWYNVPNF